MQPFTLPIPFDEFSNQLTKALSCYRPRTITDVNAKGRRVLECIIPHPTEPRFSISLQAEDRNGYVEFLTLWFGQARLPYSVPTYEVFEYIEPIVNDQAVAIVRYKNRRAYDNHRQATDAYSQWFYYLDGESAAYERMMEKLSTPASSWERFSGRYVGVFEIIRWSGSEVLER